MGQKFLASEIGVVLIWIWLTLFLLLTYSFPYARSFGSRLRNTAEMERPPLLYVDIVAIALICFGLTVSSMLYTGAIVWPLVSRSVGLFLLISFASFPLWLCALYCSLQSPQKSAASFIPAHEPVGEYSDEPIIDDTQDLLGRKAFVDRLFEQIVRLPGPSSFVFSLHAAWGEGKTSVFNLLVRRLDAHPKIIPAKRYVNSVRATLPTVVNEVDLYDFMLLEVIQVFSPKVYQDIWQRPWYYVPPSMSEAVASSPVGFAHNEDEKSRHIREHIENLLLHEEHAEILKQILEEIFSVELGKASSKSFATTRRYTAATARADKRLSEPDCFPKYFLFRIPQGEIPDRIVEELIRQWNEAPEPSVETLVEDALRLYQAEGTLA